MWVGGEKQVCVPGFRGLGRHRRQARPLRVLGHFSAALWLAVRGVAGSLPYEAEPDDAEALTSRLEAEAKRFLKR